MLQIVHGAEGGSQLAQPRKQLSLPLLSRPDWSLGTVLGRLRGSIGIFAALGRRTLENVEDLVVSLGPERVDGDHRFVV